MDLQGKRLLITGADGTAGVANSVALLARRLGAEVVGTSSPRAIAVGGRSEPPPWEVLELDVDTSEQHAALREALSESLGGLDGAFHRTAPDRSNLQDVELSRTEAENARGAFLSGAYTLNSAARAVLPLMGDSAGRQASIVGLTVEPSAAGPAQEWITARAALEAVNRYLACDLGPRRVRVNLVAVTPATGSTLGRASSDAVAAARAACFLLSDWARAVSGEILRVDAANDPEPGR